MVNHNEKWVKSVSKEEFLKHQKHHSKDTDLEADYDRIATKGKEKTPKEKES